MVMFTNVNRAAHCQDRLCQSIYNDNSTLLRIIPSVLAEGVHVSNIVQFVHDDSGFDIIARYRCTAHFSAPLCAADCHI